MLPRPVILLPLLALLVGALLWLPSASWVSPQTTTIWRGYQTLMVRSNGARGEDLSAVVARLGPGVVSEVTAPFEFWDFTGLSTAMYSELNRRLDPLDPRRDRYIDGAAGYFHASRGGAEWHIAYIPAVQTSLRLWLRVCRVLGLPFLGQWRLVEFEPMSKLLSLLALFGLAVLLALAQEEKRRQALASALAGAALWTPFLLSGGLAQFALTLILLPTWFPLMRAGIPLRGDDQAFARLKMPFIFYGCAAAAGCGLTLITRGLSVSSLVGFLSPFMVSILLLPLPAVCRSAGVRYHRRTIFEPVPIVRPRGEALRGRSPALCFATIALALIGLLSLVRGPALPTPLPVSGARDFSWGSLQRLKRASRTPVAADFLGLVTHAAFQETMTFGRPWRPPERDERVYVREFALNPVTGATVARQKLVKVFDATWLASVRQRSTPGSLGALFYAQGRPSVVVLRGPERASLRDLPTACLVLFTFLAWLRRDLVRGPLIRGNLLSLNSPARRNQAQ